MKLKLQTKKRSNSKPEPEGDYKQLILTFEDYNKTVKLINENKGIISFVKGTNPEFGIYDINGEFFLDKTWEPYVFEGLLGLECTDDRGKSKGECTFDPTVKKIKVGKGTNEDPGELEVTDTTTNKFELHEDEEGYNQGYKFVFKGTKVQGSDSGVSLEENGNYELKWKFVEGSPRTVYLVKKP